MEFETNQEEEEDFNSDPTFLWENHIEQELGNEFSIDECSPKGFFQDFPHFDKISIDNASSSLDQFDVPSPHFHPFELYDSPKPITEEESDKSCNLDQLDCTNSNPKLVVQGSDICPIIDCDNSAPKTLEEEKEKEGDKCCILDDIYKSKGENEVMEKCWNSSGFSNCSQETPIGMVELDECPPPPDFQEFIVEEEEEEEMNYGIQDENSCNSGDHATYQKIEFDRSTSRPFIGRRTGKAHRIPRGQWTSEEDRLLARLVDKYGLRSWSHIAQMLKGRIGKQCRERWHNHLRPNIKKETWTEEEDIILIQTHAELGNKWAEIAKRLPGRTENSIKNHWNATKRKQFTKRRTRTTKGGNKSTLLQNYIKGLASSSRLVDYHKNGFKSLTNSYKFVNSNMEIGNNNSSSSMMMMMIEPPPSTQPQEDNDIFASHKLIQNYNFDENLEFNYESKMVSEDCSIESFFKDVPCESLDEGSSEVEKPEDMASVMQKKKYMDHNS